MAQDTEAPETSFLEIAEADYKLWRHHPVTKVWLQYIVDYSGVLEREAIARWKSGVLKLTEEQEMRGRVMACLEMADLSFESIRSFYDGEKSENETPAS